eukprot:1838680-Rhodomonas_salina.1
MHTPVPHFAQHKEYCKAIKLYLIRAGGNSTGAATCRRAHNKTQGTIKRISGAKCTAKASKCTAQAL